jgi:hypothetical protein
MITISYKICVCVAIFISLVTLGSIWHLGNNSMIACGFFGATFIHVASRPGWKRLGAAAMASAAFAGSYVAFGGQFAPTVLTDTLGAGAFLGLGSLAVMSFDVVWLEDRAYMQPLRHALVLPAFSLAAGVAMGLFNGRPQPTYDLFLYAFDAALGFSPSQVVTSIYHAVPWVAATANTVYASLLIFPPLYHAWAWHRGIRRRVNLMYAFAIAGVCGFVLYQLCPAEGPLYCFGAKFPGQLPPLREVHAHPYPSSGVHNAIPSMHMSWALLVWWSAWELGSPAIVIASAFVGFTALATLGSGEHYLIDLIVAVPFVTAINGLCSRIWRQAVAGFGVVLGWLALLRWGAALGLPPAANWALVIGTLVCVVFLERSKPFGRASAPVPRGAIEEPGLDAA